MKQDSKAKTDYCNLYGWRLKWSILPMAFLSEAIVKTPGANTKLGAFVRIDSSEAVNWGAPEREDLLALVLGSAIVLYAPFSAHGIRSVILRHDRDRLADQLRAEGIDVTVEDTCALWRHAIARHGLTADAIALFGGHEFSAFDLAEESDT